MKTEKESLLKSMELPAKPRPAETARTMTIKNVTIGDVFAEGKHLRSKVVDFLEQKSLTTGKVVGYVCIAQGMGLAQNEYPVNFTTVLRHKIITQEVSQ